MHGNPVIKPYFLSLYFLAFNALLTPGLPGYFQIFEKIVKSCDMSYLVIGAGPCGLAAAKALKDAAIIYDHAEADCNIGGNWLHGVYSSVYTDACKDVMQYPEWPMPGDYPDFLSKELMLTYLNNYADHFDLRKKIKFNTKVVWVEAVDNNQWKVNISTSTNSTASNLMEVVSQIA